MSDDPWTIGVAMVGVGFILIGITGTILYHPLFSLFATAGGLAVGYTAGWNEYNRTITGRGDT